jgi:hypothetical protein
MKKLIFAVLFLAFTSAHAAIAIDADEVLKRSEALRQRVADVFPQGWARMNLQAEIDSTYDDLKSALNGAPADKAEAIRGEMNRLEITQRALEID